MKANYREVENTLANALTKQIATVARSSRTGWVKSRRIRFHQIKPFLRFIAEKFMVRDIRNIQPKHVQAYIRHRRELGIKDVTVLSDISTIRFWHKQIPRRGYIIPSNRFLLGDEILNGEKFRQKR
ncbi:phage integrase N-terminal domain-containing protein [Desulfolucanica intricata]|uniref:phage integrase N-terminal domain-containing protein n=1 Tax=Desulfolucanica intricata TaxID=1285191 RepID=UPI000829CBDB|nr:phage integrase N-terminal domain-containing protein [Desulfolucanica intricata]